MTSIINNQNSKTGLDSHLQNAKLYNLNPHTIYINPNNDQTNISPNFIYVNAPYCVSHNKSEYPSSEPISFKQKTDDNLISIFLCLI